MLWYLLWYLITGIVVTTVVVIIHMRNSLKRGCSASSMNSVYTGIIQEHATVVSFTLGLLIWPIRVAHFVMSQNELFDAYNQDKESEESK